MSALLERAALLDHQRAADLAANDAAMQYDSNQGRIGLESVNASRAIFRLAPLTEEPEPITLPWPVKLYGAACLLAVAAISAGWMDHVFPRI